MLTVISLIYKITFWTLKDFTRQVVIEKDHCHLHIARLTLTRTIMGTSPLTLPTSCKRAQWPRMVLWHARRLCNWLFLNNLIPTGAIIVSSDWSGYLTSRRDRRILGLNWFRNLTVRKPWHYGDVITGAIASQITSLTIVCSTAYSGADQRKHQSAASLAFVRGIHRGPENVSIGWRHHDMFGNSIAHWPTNRRVQIGTNIFKCVLVTS